jgi:hypothetical protein
MQSAAPASRGSSTASNTPTKNLTPILPLLGAIVGEPFARRNPKVRLDQRHDHFPEENAMALPRRRVGKTRLEVTTLGLGGAPMGGFRATIPDAEAVALTDTCL